MTRSTIGGATRLGWLAAAAIWGLAAPAMAQQIYFYPAAGQTAEQQSQDMGECHAWAVQQTGSDPTLQTAAPTATAAPPPGGQVIRGAARGAVIGGVGGAILDDAGKGAAVGATTGALVGGMRRRDASREQAADQEQQAAAQQQQADNFNRALIACMQGRGYSVD